MENYVLRGGDRAAERLRLLARNLRPTTLALLGRVGVRAGMHCLDLGCALGAVTLELAELVEPGGRAVGVDRDESTLALARREAARQDWQPSSAPATFWNSRTSLPTI